MFSKPNKSKSTNNVTKKNVPRKPDDPHFLTPKSIQKSKVSFSKGKTNVDNFNQWLEPKGTRYQSKEFSQDQVKNAYENYLCESSNGLPLHKKHCRSHQNRVK